MHKIDFLVIYLTIYTNAYIFGKSGINILHQFFQAVWICSQVIQKISQGGAGGLITPKDKN